MAKKEEILSRKDSGNKKKHWYNKKLTKATALKDKNLQTAREWHGSVGIVTSAI